MATKAWRFLIGLMIIAGAIALLFVVSGRVAVYYEGLTQGVADDNRCDICGSNLEPIVISVSTPGYNPNFNPSAMPDPISNPLYVNVPQGQYLAGGSPKACFVFAGEERVHEYCEWHGGLFVLLHPFEALRVALPGLEVPFERSLEVKMAQAGAITALALWGFIIPFACGIFLGVFAILGHKKRGASSGPRLPEGGSAGTI